MAVKYESLNMPTRQSFSSIELIQVPEIVGREMGVFSIENRSADNIISENKARAKLGPQLEDAYWWLNTNWSKKAPIEQVLASTSRLGFNIFNFDRSLTQNELDKLKLTTSIFSQLNAVVKINAILLNDEQRENNYSGQALNGEGFQQSRTIDMQPNSRRDISHRIFEVDNFTGTLVHEIGHFLVDNATSEGTQLINKWIKEMDWVVAKGLVVAPGGAEQGYFLQDDKNVITNYAKYSPFEDFTDSLVAALFARDRLDPKRLEFLDRELNTDVVDLSKNNAILTKRSGAEIVMPRINQVFYYSRRPIGIFTLRSS